ncbi:cation:proton antiporter [Pseudoxanthomonas sp. X-1]|uniref:cation:proton antiporter n=1 Tax=Pseudoxanthomonas sp. X-1 TaxID=2571115 RepID=UPI00110A0F0A|nr:cation:proton antiporter [Pseudoxanthomonas sp. X-1]TMN25338.1 cation:proton antiporter [Pseudoxanthomonas sp. X-1]UAY73892.1 cation:proton antiporter [Pseudoxanthomonas sp. X-1]
MSRELIYLLLIFGLLVIPRFLQQFKLPAPLTCLAFGVVAALVIGKPVEDGVVALMASLGISSLFLFAGLEVDPKALRKGWKQLVIHLLARSASLAAVAWLAWRYAGLSWQAAALLALALLTPSTGFIIDTLGRLGLDTKEQFWVTNKAIAGELLALAVLFVVLQSASPPLEMLGSTLALLAMLVGLPLLFIALGRWVLPHSPGAEFSLLVMVGVIAAYVTHLIGVHDLVGAFVTGLVARLLRQRMPTLASHDNLHAVRLFASFFVPFYFFYSGTKVPAGALSLGALGVGLALTAVVLPLRVGLLALQRRLTFGESLRTGLRIGTALAPTLIFTLVLAGVLRERFAIPDALFGGLLLYATLTTLLPSLVFRTPFDVDPVETAPERYAPAAGGAAATLLAPGASEFHQERVRAAVPPAQDSGPLPEDADRTDRTA